ncbi:hypothetical protein ABB02_02032 [Clostridiaceae bacterium JG1575]|nr:hypothetical protein ABB02_02032 [Clostridiaceae bacterium JG1575]
MIAQIIVFILVLLLIVWALPYLGILFLVVAGLVAVRIALGYYRYKKLERSFRKNPQVNQTQGAYSEDRKFREESQGTRSAEDLAEGPVSVRQEEFFEVQHSVLDVPYQSTTEDAAPDVMEPSRPRNQVVDVSFEPVEPEAKP